jgi:TolA-binding protein
LLRVAGAIGLALSVAGCATQADLREQERKLSGLIEQQSRSVDELRREIEALRQQTAPRGSQAPTRTPVGKAATRLAREKVAKPGETLPPSAEIGMTLSPEGVSTEAPEPGGGQVAAIPAPAPSAPDATAVSPEASAAPPATPAPGAAAPPPPATDEDWKREVAQDRAVASTTGAPERAQYIKSLEGLEKGDCAKAIPGLKSVSSGAKGSPLSDNAIYWQARCLAARGDQRKAVSRLNEVVARYPKSDKAPAALWEQGQLQLRAGNSSAARGAFARLIRDYPASAEAGRARRKLAELQ